MSLLIVPLLYPDLAELLNFSHPFQNNFRISDEPGVTRDPFYPFIAVAQQSCACS